MLDYMQLKHYSASTIKSYLNQVAAFSVYLGKSPEQASLEEVAGYLLHLINEKHLSQSAVNSAYSGIKVLLAEVLGREWDSRILPRSRRVKRLPDVLSVSEVLSIVNAPKNLKHRTILRLLYATGLRMGELVRLRVSDVDSKRMVLLVRQGKGFKDRQVPMSEVLLDSLRKYWLQYRPKEYLFESSYTGGALSARTIQAIFQKAKQKAGVNQHASVHTLRHCYATHLLEAGVDTMTIKTFMGHGHLSSTARYLHVSQTYRPLPELINKESLEDAARF